MNPYGCGLAVGSDSRKGKTPVLAARVHWQIVINQLK